MGEVAGDTVVHMESNQAKQVMTTAILNYAAKQMVIFLEIYWLAAKQVVAKNQESITMMVDMDTLMKCREEFQNAFLNAAHVPTHWPSVCISFPMMSPGTILELNFSWN